MSSSRRGSHSSSQTTRLIKFELPDYCAVFVHAGAGYHSTQNENHHLRACQLACKAAMAAMREGGSAVDGVEYAIKVLEDDSITNSGYGSNLTSEGRVECDASIMDGSGRSGAVGASDRVTNPISLSRMILDNSVLPLSLKRVPPILLVGDGAMKYAKQYDFPICNNDQLISHAAKVRYKKWKKELEASDQRTQLAAQIGAGTSKPMPALPIMTDPSIPPTPQIMSTDVDIITDTVGAICIDKYGRIAAGSSSGGIGMKHPGRVGPAALIGIGTWAKESNGKTVGVVTSGTGEHMAPTLIASQAAARIWDSDDEMLATKDIINDDFMGHPAVMNASSAGALGLIAVKAENISENKRMISFVFGHNTDSMALASMSSYDQNPKVIMSRSLRTPKLSIGGYSKVLTMKRVEVPTDTGDMTADVKTEASPKGNRQRSDHERKDSHCHDSLQ